MSARSFDINVTHKQSNIQVLAYEDGSKGVFLHGHKVCSLKSNEIILNSCGWRTVTTKTAINRTLAQSLSEYSVIQQKGEWFLCRKLGKGLLHHLVPFVDGMSINF